MNIGELLKTWWMLRHYENITDQSAEHLRWEFLQCQSKLKELFSTQKYNAELYLDMGKYIQKLVECEKSSIRMAVYQCNLKNYTNKEETSNKIEREIQRLTHIEKELSEIEKRLLDIMKCS